ncbi:hypothetical protein POUND7_010998 [Theobroma cacao]
MGIPSEMRDVFIQRRRNSFVIPSPAEEEKRSRAERFSQEGVRAGVKAAAIAAVVSAVPTEDFCFPPNNSRSIILNSSVSLVDASIFLHFRDNGYKLQIFSTFRLMQLIAVRKIPWAKANLNHTAQALIISGASIAAFFITVDKTVLESARRNSRAQFDKTV